jgi:alpha-L-fucosidase
MDSDVDGQPMVGVSARVRILAYLGELRREDFVPVKKLINDLSLRFTTAKNVLSQLESEWLVEKKITTTRGTVASFRIAKNAVTQRRVNGVATVNHPSGDYVPYVPPEWEAEYGQHPYGT